MKKFLLPCLALAAFILASCDKESYRHEIDVMYPEPLTVAVVMADQPTDSLIFVTSDNFRITSQASWITVPDTIREGKINYNYFYAWIVPAIMSFEPNTTGEIRTGMVSVNSYGDDGWNQTATATYTQLAWLDITQPQPNYAYNEGIITKAAFELSDSATQVADTLKFRVYGDWTLTEGTFVHPAATAGVIGAHTVVLAIDPNTTTGERCDTIKLVSRGVTTPIAVKQKGK